jgi:hypothetical protein
MPVLSSVISKFASRVVRLTSGLGLCRFKGAAFGFPIEVSPKRMTEDWGTWFVALVMVIAPLNAKSLA